MTAPVWLVSAHHYRGGENERRLVHAVVDGTAACGTFVRSWQAPRQQTRCARCVTATSPATITWRDVVEQSGMSYRQLDHAIRCRWIRCAVPAAGSGTQRLFSPTELRVAVVMARLVRAGVAPQAAVRAARSGFLADGIRLVLDDEPQTGVEAVAVAS